MTTTKRRLVRAPRYCMPAQRCPECGEAPPVRVSLFERQRYARILPSEEVQTVQCRNCDAIYALTAGAMAQAA